MVAKKIAYNVVFSAVSKVLSTALALIGIGYIMRYLGEAGFGDYSIVVTYFALFGAVADLGLYAVATREISRENANERKIMGNVFSLRLFVSCVVLILTPVLIIFLPYSAEVKLGIFLAALAFVFSSGYMVLNGVFQKNLAMDKVALVELFGKVIQVSVIVWAVKMDWGFTTIVLAMVFSMVSNFFLVFFASRKFLRFKLQVDFSYWRKFLKKSLPMGVSVISTFMYFKMDTIILSFFKESGDVGIYSAAYKIVENISFFPAMIVGLTLPLTSRYIFDDKKKFGKVSDKTFKIFILLTTPLVIGALLLANDIISLLGGGKFEESVMVLRILVFAILFIFFGNFFSNILLAGNLQKKMMKVSLICAVFNILANLIFIPMYSYVAAAVVSVATEALMVFLSARLVVAKLKYAPSLKGLLRFLGSGAVMAVVVHVFRDLNFFILVLLGGVIYFVCLYFFKAIDKEEILSIIRK